MVFRIKIQKEAEITEFKNLLKKAYDKHKKTGEIYAIKCNALTSELYITPLSVISLHQTEYYENCLCMDGIICAIIRDGNIRLHDAFKKWYLTTEYWESFVKEIKGKN